MQPDKPDNPVAEKLKVDLEKSGINVSFQQILAQFEKQSKSEPPLLTASRVVGKVRSFKPQPPAKEKVEPKEPPKARVAPKAEPKVKAPEPKAEPKVEPKAKIEPKARIPEPKEPAAPMKWSERQAAEKARLEKEKKEREAALLIELLAELKELDEIDPRSSCSQYRADGRSPWKMIEAHSGKFRPRVGDDDASRTTFLREIFNVAKSPDDWMAVWIGSHPAGKPCVSTGPNFNDSQGAADASWYYGFTVPDLTRIGPGAAELTAALGFPAKACKENGVELLTDSGDIDNATIIIVSGGRLGECIWLTGIDEQYVVGYSYNSAVAWQEQWWPFNRGQIQKYRDILEKEKFSDFVRWKQLYDKGR